MLLVHPGQLGERVKLADILREAHNATRDAINEKIKARTAKGIPLDDSTDWSAVEGHAFKLTAAADNEDTPTVVAMAKAILEATAWTSAAGAVPASAD